MDLYEEEKHGTVRMRSFAEELDNEREIENDFV